MSEPMAFINGVEVASVKFIPTVEETVINGMIMHTEQLNDCTIEVEMNDFSSIDFMKMFNKPQRQFTFYCEKKRWFDNDKTITAIIEDEEMNEQEISGRIKSLKVETIENNKPFAGLFRKLFGWL